MIQGEAGTSYYSLITEACTLKWCIALLTSAGIIFIALKRDMIEAGWWVNLVRRTEFPMRKCTHGSGGGVSRSL